MRTMCTVITMLSSSRRWLATLPAMSRRILIDARLQIRCSSDMSQAASNLENGYYEVTSDSRYVPKTRDEANTIRKQEVVSPANSKLLRVAIVGLPNAGKSTLTNKLMEWRVSSVSKKVHTTRKNTLASYVDGDTQMIFVDTPGLISEGERKRFQLDESMLRDPKNSLTTADVVLMLFDVNDRARRHMLHPNIMRILKENPEKPTVLVLNKIDRIQSKTYLIDIVNSLTEGYLDNKKSMVVKDKFREPKSGDEIIKQMLERLEKSPTQAAEENDENDDERHQKWRLFKDIFMISALHNDGVADLRTYLLKHAKPEQWKYPMAFVTDQQPKEIVIETIREKLLDHLHQEIPYKIDIRLKSYDYLDTGVLSISADLNCQQPNLVKMVIGPRGATIVQLADEAKQDLMNTFRCSVSLKLVVQYKKKSEK